MGTKATGALTAAPAIDPAIVEKVVLDGDLSALTPSQRLSYYHSVCASLGLNPLTKPFDYLRLNGKIVLYARRECTEQLRSLRGVSLTITARELVGDVYVVSARAVLPDGRTDESTGAVPVTGLKGEALANAYLKAETKAKRRVTLSICGLGMSDESEVGSIPQAAPVHVDHSTGVIIDADPVPHAPHPTPTADADFGDLGSEAEALAQNDDVPFDVEPPDPSPVERVSAMRQRVSGSDKPSEKSLKYLYVLATKDLAWSHEDFLVWLKDNYGAASSADLSQAQVSSAIDQLKALTAGGDAS